MFNRILDHVAYHYFVIAVGLSVLIWAISGCSLEGGASWRIGMTNSNFLEVGHEVDGDKEGKTASVKLDQNLWDLLSPKSDTPKDPE